MIKFPMKFDVFANSPKGINTTWKAGEKDLPPIESAIPPEFMGPGGGYSPEALFALSIVNCIIATFKVYAERGALSYEKVEGNASLTVDKLPEGGFGMTQIDITLDVTQASHVDNVRKTLEQAIKDCAVSNSIKSGKTFHVNVS